MNIILLKAELFVEIGADEYLESKKNIRFAIDNALSYNDEEW